MRVGVLSDIHGNRQALEAVIRNARAIGVDEFLCLGDVVGYGPDPEWCVERVAVLTPHVVQGNHDLAALPDMGVFRTLFRPAAQVALEWTVDRLGSAELEWLGQLAPTVAGPWGLAAHGMPDDVMAYVFNEADAATAIERAAFADDDPADGEGDPHTLWVGHTHLPMMAREAPGAQVAIIPGPDRGPRVPDWGVGWDYGEPVYVGRRRWLVNPGSVGQPRDGDPRARWAVVDTVARTVALRAVEYAFEETQAAMVRAGLPFELVSLLGPRP